MEDKLARPANEESLKISEIPEIISELFADVDRDRNGYLSHNEIQRGIDNQSSIFSKDAKALRVLSFQESTFSNLSNDEFGAERSGISAADMKKFKEKIVDSAGKEKPGKDYLEITKLLDTINPPLKPAEMELKKLANPINFAHESEKLFGKLDLDDDGNITQAELDKVLASKPAGELQTISQVMSDNFQNFSSLHSKASGIDMDDLSELAWAANTKARDDENSKGLLVDRAVMVAGALGTVGFGAAAVACGIQAADPYASIFAMPATAYTGAFATSSAVVFGLGWADANQHLAERKEARDLFENKINRIPFFLQNR